MTASSLLSRLQDAPSLPEKLINCHPSLSRGQVWCRSCGSTRRVANGFRTGWPKCCGYTMTIDSPEEQQAIAAKEGT